MLDHHSIPLFLSFLLFLHLAASFYLKEEKYKNEIGEFEEVETITDPAKVKLLMAQPAKEKFKFIQVLIPDQFSKYDSIDHDGYISLNELIRTTGAERNAKNAFQAADKDADGEISREEFKKAPWSMKPTSGNSEDREEYVEEVKFETEEIEMDNGGNKDEEEEEKKEEGGEKETREKYEDGDKESFIEIVEGRAKDFVIKNEKTEKLERVEVKDDKEGEKQVLIEENDEEGEEVLEEEETKKEGIKPVDGKVEGIKEQEETEEKKNVKVGVGETEHIENVKNESTEATEKRNNQENEEKHKKDEEIEEKNLEHFDHERLDSEKHIEGSSQVEFVEDDEESEDWVDSNETSGESDSDQETDSEDEERKPIHKENDESFND